MDPTTGLPDGQSVFEMIQKEEEYKTFTPLFLITDPLIYIITTLRHSSWEGRTVLEALACCFSPPLVED